MAQEITKNEEYSTGSGDLVITVHTGGGHTSNITIMRGQIMANGMNTLRKNTGPVSAGKAIVIAKISRTGASSHVSLTIELKDDFGSKEYPYRELAEDDVVRFKVDIHLK